MPTAREDTVRLADLLRREHHALAEFLIALAAFDRERRWSELGFASLFDFLRRELKLSAGAAQYRKTAAELIRIYPAVEAGLRGGELCLSSVIELAKVLTPENADEVMPRFFGKSARDAAFVAASIRPVQDPPARDFLVTPVRSAPPGDGIHITAGVFRTSEVTVAVSSPAPVPAPAPALVPVPDRPKVRPLDTERARINMTVSRRLLEKLATARDALSHSHPGASEETILEVGLDLIIARYLKRRGIGAKPRKPARAPKAPAAAVETASGVAPPPPPPTRRSRYVRAEVRRAVWERDGGRCAYPLENGGVCGSTYQLELDHIKGFALGAGNTAEELRLACRPHQDVHARALYGDELMNRYTKPKGPRCSEPAATYAAHGRASARAIARPSARRERGAEGAHQRLAHPRVVRPPLCARVGADPVRHRERRRDRHARAVAGGEDAGGLEVLGGAGAREQPRAVEGRRDRRRDHHGVGRDREPHGPARVPARDLDVGAVGATLQLVERRGDDAGGHQEVAHREPLVVRTAGPHQQDAVGAVLREEPGRRRGGGHRADPHRRDLPARGRAGVETRQLGREGGEEERGAGHHVIVAPRRGGHPSRSA
jgi:hypothetical protein